MTSPLFEFGKEGRDEHVRKLPDLYWKRRSVRKALIEAEQRLAMSDTPRNRTQLAVLKETQARLDRDAERAETIARILLRDVAREEAAKREGA